MKIRNVLLSIVLFLLVLTGIRLIWIELYTQPSSASAHDGVLDLRSWDFNDRTIQSLAGGWEFYPNELITATSQLTEEDRTSIVQVPGDWSKLFNKENHGTFGYGSYRLRVLVEPNDARTYSIRVPALPASSSLYVNGRLLGHSGVPADSKATYTPSMTPYTVTFSTDEEKLELIVQMANFNDRIMGGMRVPIKLGSEAAISRLVWFTTGVQGAVVLILLLHALYALALYISVPRQRSPLYFSALLVCAVISILVDDDRILPSLTGIDYDWTYKLYYLSYLGAAVLLLQYARHLLLGGKRLPGNRAYTLVCGGYALAMLILPIEMISATDTIHSLITVVPFVAAPVLAVRAIRSGDFDAVFLLLGTAAFMNNMIWGIAKNMAMIDLSFYPIDLLAGFAAFALYWLRLYFRMADQSRKLAARLQEEDKRKDEFLVQTSHELRNPLHGMLNIAQTVLDSRSGLEEEQNKERLRLLLTVGKRMSLLLNDLLDLTRLKEGRVRLSRCSVQLYPVVSSALEMVHFLGEAKPIRFENRVAEDFPAIHADEGRLVQILFNLLHNALKFTSEGTIAVDAVLRDGQVVITVSDTGIGMSKEDQLRIFQPYEQGPEAETSSVTGIGLGLSISRQLVELHEGKLTVRSAPGQGSSFAFTLPLFASRASALTHAEGNSHRTDAVERTEAEPDSGIPHVSESGNEPAPASGASYAVLQSAAALLEEKDIIGHDHPEGRFQLLLVDDDSVNLSIVSGLLSRSGYTIRTASSGKEALQLLHSQEWNLVITDVMMPHHSGYELTREIRKHFSLSELPVLLLTARGRTEDIQAGFQAGANDYVIKPVDALELRSRVRALTELTHTVREQQRTEAAWLQAQIQPHFLFNTLNSISALGELDIEQMRMLLNVFGDYLRYSFDFRNSDRLVPLGYELELVRAYLYIEKVRFEDRINVIWEVDELPGLLVPPLSIQPIVENAVRHGILKHSTGGTIRIRVAGIGEEADISVQDDGPGMDPQLVEKLLYARRTPGARTGIGLINTDRRLKQLFGKGIRIESALGQGTRISFQAKL